MKLPDTLQSTKVASKIENNKLLYLDKRAKFSPQLVRSLQGRWRIDNKNKILFQIKREGKYKTLFKSEIIDARRNYLLIKIKTKPSPQEERISFFKLKGRLFSDKFNRLGFEVKSPHKEQLIFKGAWTVNKYHQITYTHQHLKTKTKDIFTLKGRWQLSSRDVLSYFLEKDRRPTFNFRVNFLKKIYYSYEKSFAFKIKIGAGKLRRKMSFSFRGEWVLRKRGGVYFVLKHQDENFPLLAGGYLYLKDKSKLLVELKAADGTFSGVKVIFSRPSLPHKDFEYFLRLLYRNRERRLEIGGIWRF